MMSHSRGQLRMMIKFYLKLLRSKKIEFNGPAHGRLKEFQQVYYTRI